MVSRVDLQVSGSLNTFILQSFGYYGNSNCSGKEKVNEIRNKFIGRHYLQVKYLFVPWGTKASNGNCVSIGLYRSWCISSCFYFNIFSLPLVFKSLIMMCLGMDFFRFILFGLYLASWICGFISFRIFERFLTLFSFYFSGTQWYELSDLLLFSHQFLGLLISAPPT